MRRAARTDANQPEIVAAYRALGWTVVHTHMVGNGFPDLIVGRSFEITDLIEIKNGGKPPSERRLTPDEERFKNNWLGRPVRIIESVDDVIAHNEEVSCEDK